MPSLARRILDHEDLIEVDFQRFYGLDYRDRYRPGGGPSHLTFRRLLLLADHLPRESLFKAACESRAPRSFAEERLMDIPEAMTGQLHPIRENEKKRRREIEQAPAREKALAKMREREKKYGKPQI